MADYIVGLDFGSRAIKLVMIDNTDDPVVVDYDREPLALDRDPYLERPEARDAENEAEPESTDAAGETSEDGEGGESDAADAADDGTDGSTDETAGPSEETGDWEAGFGPSHSWVETLDTLLTRHDFEKGTQFVTFLPEGRAISIHQDVPFPEPDKVKSILPNLLEDRLPLDPHDIVYDFELITSDEGGEKEGNVAVVGIGRKNDIRAFLGNLGDSQLNP
ncbi:MAG: hypothetical protein ABEN55_08545, partial [Bradymonadaceae bacterium]